MADKSQKIKLGNEVEDIVTGLIGIAYSYCVQLDGSEQVGVKYRAKGSSNEIEYVYLSMLKKIGDGIKVKTTPRVSDVSREIKNPIGFNCATPTKKEVKQ